MTKKRANPVGFAVRPITRGLNYSLPPQLIDMRETPNALNDRYERGRLRKRSGFAMKYYGADESLIWIDQAWSSGGGGESTLIAISSGAAWFFDGTCMIKADCYDSTGSPADPPWAIDPGLSDFVPSVDIGSGRYNFVAANSGAEYPTSTDYADIGVFSAGTSDGLWIFTYTGTAGSEVEFEQIGGDAPTLARCVCIFDQRIIAGGVIGASEENYSLIQWSSKGQWDDWSTASGGGFTVIGDSPDWIQAMRRLGDNLIVYKERSIYVGRKTYLSDPPLRFDPAPGQGIGLAAPNSVGDLGEEHLFLGWDDVYAFSLKQLQPIGTRVKEEMFYGANGIIPAYIGLSTGIIAEEFDEYWLFVATGKWPGSVDTPLVNYVSNPIFNNGTDGVLPTDWILYADGDGTALLNVDNGGTFGPNTMDLIYTTGVVAQGASVYDFSEIIDGRKFSAVAWISTPDDDVTYRLGIQSRDGAHTSTPNQGYIEGTISAADGITRVVFSATVDDADAEEILLYVSVKTASKTLEVHATHIVRLDNLEPEYITGVSGAEEPGYIRATLDVQPIPLIVDKIGNYMTDTVWVFNYEENAWSQWRLPMTGFGYDVLTQVHTISSLVGTISEQTWRYDEKRLQDTSPSNLIAQADGRIYELADAYEDDWHDVFDIPIVTYWESKDFDFDQPTQDKTFARLVIFHPTDAAPITVTVGISTDSGDTWFEQDVVIRNGHTDTFADFFRTGPQARFRLRTQEAGLYVNGFSVKVIPRGETNPY